MLKKWLYSLGKKLPPVKNLINERDSLLIDLTSCKYELTKQLRDKDPQQQAPYKFVPPGHYYSPIPSIEEVKQKENVLWGPSPKTLKAIDLNEEEQLRVFDEFSGYYGSLPFPERANHKTRYYYENPSYSYSDAISLFSMIRKTKPKRIIEAGSGYSSCVMMDTNELFFDNQIKIDFIEPYPELLKSLMKENDKQRYQVIPSKLQDVKLEQFLSLEENDILFIDSTHVSKIGSDVNYLLFQILPSLNKGVFIHFHDIFYPFEYPKDWIYQGYAWNEDYILRAFLEYNNDFKIVFWNNYLIQFYMDRYEKYMPLCLNNGGASIWLNKVQ
jgi:hypothetical protein